MKIPIIVFLLALLLLSGIACRKHRMDSNGLPPATQEGKNTLGFLLNGKPWTPKGFRGESSNLSLDYEPDYKNGGFNIVARDFTNPITEQFIIGIIDSLNFLPIPSTISLNHHGLLGVMFSNQECEYFSSDSDTYSSGSLTITKLDVTDERVIISGKFNATLYKPGCDSIRITDGRFDLSLH